MSRKRLDRELVDRGLVNNLAEARSAIAEHRILVDGAPALKAETMIKAGSDLNVISHRKFASRAGEKLDGALTELKLDVTAMRCLDAGAGSGGFTDCLLQRGAASVVSVDVGYGQFDWRLRNDPRVDLLERTNVREVARNRAGQFDLVVADLSFVSLASMLPSLVVAGAPKCVYVVLVKPQFELDPSDIPAGGVVTDPAQWEEAVDKASDAMVSAGLEVAGVSESKLPGAGGNREFFLMGRGK